MSRQIGHQNAETMMGKEARLKPPEGLIIATAMHKYERGFIGAEILSPGMGKNRATIDCKFHDPVSLFLRGAQRLLEVRNNVAVIFQTNREAHHVFADTSGFQIFGAHLLVGGACGVDHQ